LALKRGLLIFLEQQQQQQKVTTQETHGFNF